MKKMILSVRCSVSIIYTSLAVLISETEARGVAVFSGGGTRGKGKFHYEL